MKKFISILILGIILTSCTPVATAIESNRCIQASTAQITGINDGVKQTDSKNSIKSAWAVQSKDFDKVYMVAARIYGPGMDGSNVGVWAISGDPNQPGMILAVDGTAQSFSPYPDASKTKAQITQFDDGVAEAKACALQNK